MKTTIENSTRQTAFCEMFAVFIFSLNRFPFNERQLKVLHLLVYVLRVMQKALQYLFCSFFLLLHLVGVSVMDWKKFFVNHSLPRRHVTKIRLFTIRNMLCAFMPCALEINSNGRVMARTCGILPFNL